VDTEGTPQMLEINPNCGLFYAPEDAGSADFILLNHPGGHKGFLESIMRAGIRRSSRSRRPWAVRSNRDGDFRMEAAEFIPAGDLIEAYEERAQVLVSKAHALANWDPIRLDWFRRYAWPLTESVYVAWSDNPSEWKPINHSCEPSAWLDGMNLVARRDLSPGEEITMDYATLYNETMPAFDCACGSDACRGVIRGTDYAEPFVARYGTHVSDYVRTRRDAMGLPAAEAGAAPT
jgi:D-alanine-D-alanine ligase